MTSNDRQPRVVLATDDSVPAQIAEDWVGRLRFESEPIIDVVCAAGAGMTRLGWGMQTYREPVRQAIEGIRQRELYAAERISNAGDFAGKVARHAPTTVLLVPSG